VDLVMQTRQEGGASVVTSSGAIDVFTAPDLDEGLMAVLSRGATKLVLDLSGVTFLDSTGLGVLVKCLKQARGAGGWVRLVVQTEKIRKIFDITGLDAAMPLFDTVSGALSG
jgi:anti-sigma B factor antagonist